MAYGFSCVLLPRLVQHLAGDAREFIIAVRAAILQVELESAGVPKTLHRRRRHGKNRGILDRARTSC